MSSSLWNVIGNCRVENLALVLNAWGRLPLHGRQQRSSQCQPLGVDVQTFCLLRPGIRVPGKTLGVKNWIEQCWTSTGKGRARSASTVRLVPHDQKVPSFSQFRELVSAHHSWASVKRSPSATDRYSGGVSPMPSQHRQNKDIRIKCDTEKRW